MRLYNAVGLNSDLPHALSVRKENQKGFLMVIIAFSKKTSKFIPNILCRKYKHCAPVLKQGRDYIMLQFVRLHEIKKIRINKKSIKILQDAGWSFIKTSYKPNRKYDSAKTCVDLVKKVIGMKNFFIQTPYSLYKKLKRPNGRFYFLAYFFI